MEIISDNSNFNFMSLLFLACGAISKRHRCSRNRIARVVYDEYSNIRWSEISENNSNVPTNAFDLDTDLSFSVTILLTKDTVF